MNGTLSLDAAIYHDLLAELQRQEDADLMFGFRTDRVILFDDYRLGDCIEECDRLQLRRRWADARLKKVGP
jgi:hypothetical protein